MVTCRDCGVELTAENVACGDPKAVFCVPCWAEYPPWEPECPECRVKLKQRKTDLTVLYCPACNQVKMRLSQPN